jgi:hypothetical protein
LNYVVVFLLHSYNQMLSLMHQYFVYICCCCCIINQKIKKYQTLGHFCESLYGRGVNKQVVVVHFLVSKLHSCSEGWVVSFPSLVVELICDMVHHRNDGSNTGGFLREKESGIFVLL